MWSVTEYDIRMKLKLKLGFIQAKSVQEYQVLSDVVSKALGGGKKTSQPPATYLEAASSFASVFGSGNG